MIAKHALLGDVTTSSLEKNLSQFKKNVNIFRENNQINYSREITSDSSLNALAEAGY